MTSALSWIVIPVVLTKLGITQGALHYLIRRTHSVRDCQLLTVFVLKDVN